MSCGQNVCWYMTTVELQEMKKKMRDEYLSLGGSPNKVRHASILLHSGLLQV